MNVLYVGESVYAETLQHVVRDYETTYPQRRVQLFRELDKFCNIVSHFYKGPLDLNQIESQKQKFRRLEKADLVLIDNPLSFLLVRDVNVPIVMDYIDWYEEMYLTEFGLNEQYYLLCYAKELMLRSVDVLICQSPVIARHLLRYSPKTSYIYVIPNGYNAGIFFYAPTIAHDDKIKVVFCGKLGVWYRSLLNVVKAVQSNSKMYLTLIGSGPLEKDIPNHPRIRVTGAQALEDVPKCLTDSHVCIFPANDCSPIAVSEYLAIGRPIVHVKNRISWLLEHGKNGYLIDDIPFFWERYIQRSYERREVLSENNHLLASGLDWATLASLFYKALRQEKIEDEFLWQQKSSQYLYA